MWWKTQRYNHQFWREPSRRSDRLITSRREGELHELRELFSSSTDTLDTSFDHGGKADLCLAMGSSLTVTPAANIPEVCTLSQ